MRKRSLIPALAEIFGTFCLVLAGCGAILVETQTQALGHGGVAGSFGLVILIMVLATGHVSGAHLNPAVTLAFLSLGKVDRATAVSYIISQLLGATLAAVTLAFLLPEVSEIAHLGATLPSGTPAQSFVLEVLLTAMLMFVITSVATDSRAPGPLAAATAIGGTVALGALWGGPISGASMNPARSFGPALISQTWESHWLYWVAPITGALLGAWAYRLLRDRESAEAS